MAAGFAKRSSKFGSDPESFDIGFAISVGRSDGGSVLVDLNRLSKSELPAGGVGAFSVGVGPNKSSSWLAGGAGGVGGAGGAAGVELGVKGCGAKRSSAGAAASAGFVVGAVDGGAENKSSAGVAGFIAGSFNGGEENKSSAAGETGFIAGSLIEGVENKSSLGAGFGEGGSTAAGVAGVKRSSVAGLVGSAFGSFLGSGIEGVFGIGGAESIGFMSIFGTIEGIGDASPADESIPETPHPQPGADIELVDTDASAAPHPPPQLDSTATEPQPGTSQPHGIEGVGWQPSHDET